MREKHSVRSEYGATPWLAAGALIVLVAVLLVVFGGQHDGPSGQPAVVRASEPVAESTAVAALAPTAAVERSAPLAPAIVETDRAPLAIDAPEPVEVNVDDEAEVAPRPIAIVDVHDEHGTPVAGATLSLVSIDAEGKGDRNYVIDVPMPVSGRFELDLVFAPSDRLLSRVSAPGYQRAGGFLVQSGHRWERELVLVPLPPPPPGPTVTGRIIDASGAPVDSATLTFTRLDEARTESRTTVRGLIDGRFTVSAPSAGAFEVAAAAQQVGLSAGVRVQVGAIETLDIGTLQLRGNGTIAGRVTVSGGIGVAGVEVYADSAGRSIVGGLDATETVTDDDGRFQLTGLGGGAFDLSVYDQRFATLRAAAVPVGADDFQFVLDGWVLAISAVDDGGAPVAIRELELIPLADDDPRRQQRFRQDFPFTVDQTVQPVGRARLSVRAHDDEGGVYSAVIESNLPAGAQTIVLNPGNREFGSLRVIVEGAEEDRTKGWMVTLFPSRRSVRGGASALGRDVVLDALEPGSLELVLSARSVGTGTFERSQRVVEILAGQETLVEFRQTVGGRLTVEIDAGDLADDDPRVLGATAEVTMLLDGALTWFPLPVKELGAESGSRALYRAPLGRTLSAAGLYEPGVHQIRIECPGFEPWTGSVRIVSGGESALRAELVPVEPAAAATD